MPTHSPRPRPRDANQLGKMVVDIATGQLEDKAESESKPVDEVKRKAGLKGGRARSQSLEPERRSEIAAQAAKARWED